MKKSASGCEAMASASSDRIGSNGSLGSLCSIRSRGYFFGISCRVSLRSAHEEQISDVQTSAQIVIPTHWMHNNLSFARVSQ